jgi:hypothetical protein
MNDVATEGRSAGGTKASEASADSTRARAAKALPVALTLARMGFRVIQVPQGGKHPSMMDWPNRATSNTHLIETWDGHWPAMNWGVLCGRKGGVFVLDADGHRGIADLARLEAEYGRLTTWRSRSGRADAGEHVWLRLPPGDEDLKNQQPLAGTRVDLRSWHGQAVIPGSLHKSGRRYEWLPGCAPGEIELAECPPAWWAWLPKKESGTASRPKSVSPARHGTLVKRAHDPASYLIGDGHGYGGFENPIYRNAIRYFLKAGNSAPAEIVIKTLREMIAEAPKDEGRDASRYMSGCDLPRLVERARNFVKQVKDTDVD